MPTKTLGHVFEPKANGINLIKLVFAVIVVVFHSFLINGITIESDQTNFIVNSSPVNGFFVLSGFLIARTLESNPNPGHYLMHRFSRLYPSYWVTLAFTALVLAPLASGGFDWSNLRYVVANATLLPLQSGIDGTLQTSPVPTEWNSSLWTLPYDFALYLIFLLLSMSGLFRKTMVLSAGFLIAVAVRLSMTWFGVNNGFLQCFVDFGTLFLAGALVWRLRYRIPASWYLVSALAAVVVAGLWLPSGLTLLSIPMSVGLLQAACLMKSPKFQLRQDISYGTYLLGFPVSQTLQHFGASNFGPWWLALCSLAITLPLAALLRVGVELPVKNLLLRD